MTLPLSKDELWRCFLGKKTCYNKENKLLRWVSATAALTVLLILAFMLNMTEILNWLFG